MRGKTVKKLFGPKVARFVVDVLSEVEKSDDINYYLTKYFCKRKKRPNRTKDRNESTIKVVKRTRSAKKEVLI